MSVENIFQEKCKNIIICLSISDTAFLNNLPQKYIVNISSQ